MQGKDKKLFTARLEAYAWNKDYDMFTKPYGFE